MFVARRLLQGSWRFSLPTGFCSGAYPQGFETRPDTSSMAPLLAFGDPVTLVLLLVVVVVFVALLRIAVKLAIRVLIVVAAIVAVLWLLSEFGVSVPIFGTISPLAFVA